MHDVLPKCHSLEAFTIFNEFDIGPTLKVLNRSYVIGLTTPFMVVFSVMCTTYEGLKLDA